MITAIVVDDEKMARDTIDLFVQKYFPEIKLIGKAKSVDDASKLIKTRTPDIVFLDINIPEKNGFVLFDEVDLGNIKVIFTTAYSEFAIRAINLSASYYLLKPISPIEFKLAVTKTIEKIKNQTSDRANVDFLRDVLTKQDAHSKKIIITTKNGYQLIETENILYLEGDKNYTWIYESENNHLVAKTLKEYEDILNPKIFFRSHQSHLVNKLFVKKVLNNKPDQIELKNGTLLNLSRDKKKLFLEWLAK
jgi:two-component system LytT family response regulator